MADINISELPPISAATIDDVFIINDANATTSRINWSQLQTSITNLYAPQVLFGVGTESEPSITFQGDLNNGIYSPGLDQFGIVTNGESRLHIDAAGKVAIGNKQPSSYVTSVNDLVVGNLTGDTGIVISSGSTDAGLISFADSLSNFPGSISYDHDDDHLEFNVDNSERARITSVGNFGIGTTAPQETLHVRSGVSGVTGTQSGLSGAILEGADGTDIALQFFSPATTAAGLYFSDPSNFGIGHLKYDHIQNTLSIQTNDVESFYIDRTGSVGIGATPSDTALSVTKDVTGATSYSGIAISSEIQTDVTLDFSYFKAEANTVDSAFTLTDLYHFSVAAGSISASSTVTNQYGFAVDHALSGATNNYGFYSNIATNTNTYAFYANGSADNYFNGDTFTIANTGVASLTVDDGVSTFRKEIVLTPVTTASRPSPAATGTLRYNSDLNGFEKYDGTSWGSIGGSIATSTSPPINSIDGDMWFDADAGRTYVYYNDGDSIQWVEMNPSLNGGVAAESIYAGNIASNAIITSKIADGAVTEPKLSSDVQTSLCKAFARTSSTGTATPPVGFSSVVRVSLGFYRYTFSSTQADALYAVVATPEGSTGVVEIDNKTTTTFEVYIRSTGGTLIDSHHSVLVFGS